jgi:hypothetical protein
MAKTDWPKEPLTADTMQLLDRILTEWCAEHSCEKSSERARITAKTLVDWFEFGIHDENELASLARDSSMLDLKEPEPNR